ncbi:MAG: hypothetical protein ACJA0N_001333 [Pseudohongiellaceae bacterium]|jgi:hypothetical protein
MNWQGIKEFSAQQKEVLLDSMSEGLLRFAPLFVAILILLSIAVGVYWSSEPEQFSVTVNAKAVANTQQNAVVVGTVTTTTLISVTETLLNKPGGFISNDIMPPGVWLDNSANWEYGVLIQVRDLSKAMRESFSRSQTQSTENKFLAKAEPSLNFSSDSWAVPASESEYRSAIKQLYKYLSGLGDTGQTGAQFYARADNLNYWLQTVESRLGSLSQRLSASVGQRRLNTDLAGSTESKQSTRTASELEIKTPWLKIDDVFYESRGTSWALVHFLKAIEVDFADVLEKKNARVSLQQIIRELEATQASIFSPMILNGDGFGFLANHSLVMASYISRANTAIIELRELLSKG